MPVVSQGGKQSRKPQRYWFWGLLPLVAVLVGIAYVVFRGFSQIGAAVEGFNVLTEKARSSRPRESEGLASPSDSRAIAPVERIVEPAVVEAVPAQGAQREAEVRQADAVEQRVNPDADIEADAELAAMRAELATMLEADPDMREAIEELMREVDPEVLSGDLEVLKSLLEDVE
jgi:hypothetical protein